MFQISSMARFYFFALTGTVDIIVEVIKIQSKVVGSCLTSRRLAKTPKEGPRATADDWERSSCFPNLYDYDDGFGGGIMDLVNMCQFVLFFFVFNSTISLGALPLYFTRLPLSYLAAEAGTDEDD
jgi:hypothetical protein